MLRASDNDFDRDPMQAVISERIALTLFTLAVAAVGQTIYLNDRPVIVVGVAGDEFRGAERDADVDLWLPLGADVPLLGGTGDKIRGRSGAPHYSFIVRPRRSVSLPAVAGQLKQILRRLAREEPAFDSDARLVAAEPRLTPELGLSPDVRPRVESAIRLLSGVVALVLLIACANVANLLLFRNVVKRSTVTTRMALGASPARIAREHLVQSLLLGVVGSIVGMGVGWLISRVFQGQTLGSTPAFGELPLDRRVVLFAAVASIGTALAFGTVPAALAGRFDLAAALRQTDTRHSRRMAALRSALSAGQLALTLTLGVGALLLVRTMHKLDRASTGLDFHGVVSAYQSHRVNMDRPQTDVLARRVLAAVQAVDEVRDVALGPPDLDAPYGGKTLVGPEGAAPRQRVDARIIPVTPGWFGIFHVPALRGRVFGDNDWKEGAPYNAVLTASLARKLFGTEDAVDRTLGGIFGRPALHVIGVVPNLSGDQAPDVPKDVVFVTYAFPPVTSMEFSFVIRNTTFRCHRSRAHPERPEGGPS